MAGPRVAILGSGANGASIGTDLMRAGIDVTLIDQWPAHIEAIRADGLTIEMPEDKIRTRPPTLHLCEVAELTAPFDIVLLLMKAYDTRWASQLIAPYLADDGIIAGVQNGMTAEQIAETVGVERTVATVIEISSTMYQPGLVHRHSEPARSWFAVGTLRNDARADERRRRIAELLGHSGTVAVVDDILAAKWMKLVSNCTTLVTTAALGLSMVDALAVPGMRDVMIRSGQEALDVGAALGHPILPIFGLQPRDVSTPDTVVETLLDTLYRGFVLPNTTTTVLQDWTKSRHSEVDDLNGYVVAEGRRVGVATPVNTAVVEVAHRIERGELAPGLANLEVLRGALTPT